MPRLRNEDYIAFLDESGAHTRGLQLQVVAGVLIPARWLRSAERRWQQFVRQHVGAPSGKVEFKSTDLVNGSGLAKRVQERLVAAGQPVSASGAGRRFYTEALEHIAAIAEVRVLAVGVNSKQPIDAYRLWFWAAYGLLTCLPASPRPRLPLVVIDGEDAKFRRSQDLIAYRFHRRFPKVQPYVGAGTEWFVGGSVLQTSHLSPFVQMADLVAGSARRSIALQTGSGWFDAHIRAKGAAMARDIDVSQAAIDRLRVLDPGDSIGINWSSAIVP